MRLKDSTAMDVAKFIGLTAVKTLGKMIREIEAAAADDD